MINAGAIAIASLIKKSPVEAGASLRRYYESGRRQKSADRLGSLGSETLTGNRNRAIAYLMRNFGIIDEQVNESLHQYFAQCSMLVMCQDVAMMAATLGNMGTNPITARCFCVSRLLVTRSKTCASS